MSQVADLKPRLNGHAEVTWINIDGLGDSETFTQLAELFGLHPLAMEDVMNVHQRPKLEDYAETDFIVLRMPSVRPNLDLEQLSVFLGDRFLITIQEKPGDCLEAVRDRIRNNKGRIRRRGSAYLAYSVLDAIVETFFPIVDQYTDHLEEIEAKILDRADHDVVPEIHSIRHDLRALRRTVSPTRDVVSALGRADNTQVEDDTRVFLRDCHDHTVQLLESLDSSRELAASLMELHVSKVGARMNEVMKVLTIIATIFIPLGFIAGVYGMNFDAEVSPWNMPELRWTYGYPFALALMGLTAVGLVFFFRKKGWLGKNDSV